VTENPSTIGGGVGGVGIVRGLYRYPIKSMAGEALSTAELTWQGVAGDRRFAFRRVGVTSGMPWLTATKLGALVSYRPYQAMVNGVARLRVVTPEGDDLEAEGEALRQRLTEAHGRPVDLLHLNQGVFDQAPLSLISTATLAALGSAAGRDLDPRRFRPNILVEAKPGEAFAEDHWLGKLLAFGPDAAAPAMSALFPDERCSMVNLDPETAAPDLRVLRAVAQTHGAYAGIYGTTFRTGTIRVGDEIRILSI
jgi:uncharacterized protein YcbX